MDTCAEEPLRPYPLPYSSYPTAFRACLTKVVTMISYTCSNLTGNRNEENQKFFGDSRYMGVSRNCYLGCHVACL